MRPLFTTGTKMPYASGDVKIICEGNSLMAGYGAGTGVGPGQNLSIAQHLAAMPFFAQTSITNLAVGGSTFYDNLAMTGTARMDAVEALYEAGKEHVLLLWEGTNALYNDSSYTGIYVAEQAAQCVADYKALLPGVRVVMLTTIPRYGFGGDYVGNYIGGNNALSAFDTYLKANWKAMGIDALVDVRKSGVFAASGTEYMATPMKPYQMDLCHLNGGGYGLVADMCVSALRNLAVREG